MGMLIVFDSAFTPASARGFIPMKIDGQAGGCEIDINMKKIDSLLDAHKALDGRIPTNPSIFSFRFGGSSIEGACAFAAAAALVQAFSAIFYDPQEDMLFDEPDELGPVDIHFRARVDAARWIMAVKLSSVLS
jgi:hypothetical protein